MTVARTREGMGGHSPSVFVDAATAREILTDIVHPTLRGMSEEGRPFRGLLYVGLMLENGMKPYVLEYNVRFGDPETQCTLIRMEDDLLPYLLGSARGKFEENAKPVWKKEAGAAVVLSAEGYPGPFERGKAIEGIEDATAEDGIFAFHAGTAKSADGKLVTAGGRILVLAARARGLSEALARAVAAAEKVRFDGKALPPRHGDEGDGDPPRADRFRPELTVPPGRRDGRRPRCDRGATRGVSWGPATPARPTASWKTK